MLAAGSRRLGGSASVLQPAVDEPSLINHLSTDRSRAVQTARQRGIRLDAAPRRGWARRWSRRFHLGLAAVAGALGLGPDLG
jgi:hypothetical protein